MRHAAARGGARRGALVVLTAALLVAGAAWAGDVVAAPVRPSGPPRGAARAAPYTLTWAGGPASVVAEDARGRRWTLTEGATAPWTTPPLAPFTTLVVTVDGAPPAAATATPWYTPADVAAWSGSGLRAAVVTGLAPWSGGRVWVATDGGGVAAWDGVAFRHVDRRVTGSERVRDVDARGEAVWWADASGVHRLVGDALTRWPMPDAAAVIGLDDGSAWVASREGVSRVGPAPAQQIAPPIRVDGPCVGLAPDPAGGWLARCGDGTVHLPSGAAEAGTVVARFRDDARVIDARTDAVEALGAGAWSWAAPGPVTDAAVIGGALLVTHGAGPATWIDPQLGSSRPLSPSMGAAGPGGGAVAPGPTPGSAWLGTDRGLLLVDGAQLTRLPLAPLPAGLPALDLWPDGRGGAAVAGPTGLVWLGSRPPRGWELLVAAAPTPVAVLRDAAGGWWAASGTGAVRLHRGGLTRFEADGLVDALAPAGDGVAVAVAGHVRVWLPDATRLSSALPTPLAPGTRPHGAPGGPLYLPVEGGVVAWYSGRAWTWQLPSTPHAVAPYAGGVAALTPDGAYRLRPQDEAPVRLGEPTRSLAAGPTWSAAGGPEGVLLQRGDGVTSLPVGPVDRLIADGDRLWALTPLGVALLHLPR